MLADDIAAFCFCDLLSHFSSIFPLLDFCIYHIIEENGKKDDPLLSASLQVYYSQYKITISTIQLDQDPAALKTNPI